MILEAIVTSTNANGEVNIAPMGPVIPDAVAAGAIELTQFDLKPFATSTTCANLRAHPYGVLHVVDDVMLFATAAIGKVPVGAELKPAESMAGQMIANACRAYEFSVKFSTEDSRRPTLKCTVVRTHRWRDFFGFNRARHAVIEAAILATRVDFLPLSKIREDFLVHSQTVKKTGGPVEQAAFQLLNDFVNSKTIEPGLESELSRLETKARSNS